MGTLRALTHMGDQEITWDLAAAQQGDAEAQAAVSEAERLFAEVRARGGSAFAVGPGSATTRLDTFDPAIEHVVLIPRVIGG